MPATALDDLPTLETLHELGDWTDEKQAELEAVTSALEGDPKEQAKLYTNAKSALEQIRDHITAILEVASDEAVTAFLKSELESEAS